MLKNLKVWQKLTCIGLSFSLPIAVLLFFVVQGIDANIHFAQWEQYGNTYQRPLEQLLQHLAEHRLLAHRLLDGSKHLQDDLARTGAQIEADFQALLAVDSTLSEALQTTADGLAKRKREHVQLRTVQQEWQALKAQLVSLQPAASDERHVHLIGDIRTLICHIGDTANLILDPDLDSYYLMDVTLLALPQMQDRLQAVLAYGEGILQRQAITLEERVQLSVYAALLKQSDLDRINVSTQTALNEDQNFYGVSERLQKNLPPALQTSTAALEAFIGLTQQLAQTDGVVLEPKAYVSSGMQALAASFAT